MLALAADAQASGIPAAVAQGRPALGADPVAATIVLLVLLLEPPLQQFQQLLQGLFLEHSLTLELLQGALQVLCRVVEPLQQLLRQLSLVGHVLEKLRKGLVKPVVLRLALHHDGPAKKVKPGQRAPMQALFHPL